MIEINKCKLVPGITSNWGDILGDITKQQDLVDYVASHGGGSPLWGSITGDISDQSDLMYEFALDRKRLNDLEDGTVVPTGTATEQWVESQGYLVQSDLSQYATRQWVTGRGYATENWVLNYYTDNVVTPEREKAEENVKDWVVEEGYINQIKTVNNQSLVGTGNIEISGLTPEQEEAVEPLMNPEKGMLYTFEIPSMTITSMNPNYGNECVYNLGGEIYCIKSLEVYKFNGQNFDYIKRLMSGSNSPYWMDYSGRVYDGISYQVDIWDPENSQQIDMNDAVGGMCPYGGYINNGTMRHNIWRGQYGIYMMYPVYYSIWDANVVYMFNEDTQRFDIPIELKNDTGYDLYWIFVYGGGFKEFEGHLINTNNGNQQMAELIEDEGQITLTYVSNVDPGQRTEYFPIYLPNGYYVEMNMFHTSSSGYFYLYYTLNGSNLNFKLVNDDNSWVWEEFNINRVDGMGGYYFYYPTLDVLMEDDSYLVFGGCGAEKLFVTNLSYQNYVYTGWSDISNYAVDLKSQQVIAGEKTFSYINCDTIRPKLIQQIDNPLSIYSKIIYMGGDDSTITLNGTVLSNEDYIALKGDTIQNKEIKSFGHLSRPVNNGSSYPLGQEFNYIWTTPSGRIFNSNGGDCYEFKDTTQTGEGDWGYWKNWSSMTVKPVNCHMTVQRGAGSDLYYSPGDWVYLWDDANTDWVQVFQNGDSQNPPRYVDGVFLAKNYNDGWVYRYDTSNSQWVREFEDSQNLFSYGKTHYINGHVYLVTTYDLYEIESQNGVFTGITHVCNLGIWNSYECSFTIGDNLFLINGQETLLFDFTKVGTDEYKFIPYNLPLYNAESVRTCWTDGTDTFMLIADKDYRLSFMYDMEYEKPEVPATDGTYVLKATVQDGEVTYEWVPEV